MAIPTQGGLGQVAQARPPVQAPKFDAGAVQSENIEQENAKTTGLKDTVVSDLGDQREALNNALLKMRQSLDARKNRVFDPVLMQAAAGFLKPTRTGSFGESLGYAAENAGAASERDQANQRENLKLESELTEKEMAFRTQNRIADYRLGKLGYPIPGAKPSVAPAGAPIGASAALPGSAPSSAPAGSPVPFDVSNMRPGQFPPSESSSIGRTGPTGGAIQMSLITDRDIQESYLVDPSGKLAKEMIEEAKLQREDIIMIDGRPYLKSQRRFLDGSPDTQVERNFGRYVGTLKVPSWISKQYDEVKAKAMELNKPEMVFDFFRKYDLIGPPNKTSADGKLEYESLDDKKRREEIIQERLKAQIGEEKGQITQLEVNARMGRDTINIAKDIRSFAEANSTAFDLLNNPGIADAVKRAAERGLTAGSLGNFSIPARELETYKLSADDRQALQMFAQKQAALTVQFRKSARAPSEGTTTESEGRLFSELGAMPSDTAKVIRLKMEALEEKGKYDQEVFKAWAKFSKDPSNTYREFLTTAYDENGPLKIINDAYDSRLEKMRTANANLFRTTPKPAAPTAPAAPAASAPANTPARPAATPLQSNDPSVPPGYIRDKTTSVIRKKREGE